MEAKREDEEGQDMRREAHEAEDMRGEIKNSSVSKKDGEYVFKERANVAHGACASKIWEGGSVACIQRLASADTASEY